ncbi:hypothetical protein NL676_002847 [Syzygium grande]|nr:hypothetical protein NL676_002847 [Syzygium grande]
MVMKMLEIFGIADKLDLDRSEVTQRQCQWSPESAPPTLVVTILDLLIYVAAAQQCWWSPFLLTATVEAVATIPRSRVFP